MVAVFLILEEGIVAHGRRVGAQLRQAREQQRALQQDVNQPNLLWLKGFCLHKEGCNNAHSHTYIGGYGALDALSCYYAHVVEFGSVIPKFLYYKNKCFSGIDMIQNQALP